MTRAVHQLLSDFAAGDAIGAIAQQTQLMLRDMGFRSEIYAHFIDERLRSHAFPAERLDEELGTDDAVIYHMAIGSPQARRMARLRATKVVLYHNITPTIYYRATNPRVANRLEEGRRELAMLVPRVDLCIGVSEFNVEELRLLGARRSVVVPPLLDLERLRPRSARPSSPPLLVFVSRVAPNKRHDDLIRTLAALRATAQPEARMVIVGRFTDTEAYVESLERLAADLGVSNAVRWAGRLDDHATGDLYAQASVYVCASEHEGFCVPLLEAMAFDVPVVAYAAGAVPDTLDGAGLLLRRKEPLLWAAAIDRVLRDRALRAALTSAGRRRVADFAPSVIRNRLADALHSVGIVADGRR